MIVDGMLYRKFIITELWGIMIFIHNSALFEPIFTVTDIDY